MIETLNETFLIKETLVGSFIVSKKWKEISSSNRFVEYLYDLADLVHRCCPYGNRRTTGRKTYIAAQKRVV